MNEGISDEQQFEVINEDTILSQFDITQDFRGTFYAKDNWRVIHKKLAKDLTDKLLI